jgi:hypothetical protein
MACRTIASRKTTEGGIGRKMGREIQMGFFISSPFFSRIASFFSCSILLGKTRWGLERFKNTFEVLQIVWFVSFN